MPPVFKALTTIMAWTFWIVAWVVGLSTLIMGIINGDLYGTQPVPMSYWAGFAVAIAYGIGAVVMMKLRQMLE